MMPTLPVSGVDWAAEPKPADLDPAERERRGYRMSADVAAFLAGLPGCRTLRSGMGIAVWTGPDRYVHRRPDYMIWTEDTTDRHLHKIVAAGIWRELQQDEPEEAGQCPRCQASLSNGRCAAACGWPGPATREAL